MAARDARIKHPAIPSLFAAIILTSLLLLSALRSSTVPPSHPAAPQSHSRCNYFAGAWLCDPSPVMPRYDNTCKEIFKGWNCIAVSKPNALDLLRWRPSACHLPQLDPLRFLHRYRNTKIGFVGDSLNRNVFVSLVCMLRRVSREVRKWCPARADRGFTFLRYNLTVAYHRTNLLGRYGGRLVKREVPLNLLDLERDIEWMLIYRSIHGLRPQCFITYSSSILGTCILQITSFFVNIYCDMSFYL